MQVPSPVTSSLARATGKGFVTEQPQSARREEGEEEEEEENAQRFTRPQEWEM
jgi:hypothetical protein